MLLDTTANHWNKILNKHWKNTQLSFTKTRVKHSSTRIDEKRIVKNYLMSYATPYWISTATYSVLKFPKLGPRLIIFEQYWQRLLQRQQRANSEVLTLSSFSMYLSCFSTRRDGTVVLRSSLINCFCFRVLILEETSVNSWVVASSPGCHPPNFEGDISASLVCNSTLAVRMSCPKKALTPSNTGSPRILWTDRSPDWQEKENIATSSNSVMSSGRRFLESDDFPEGRSLDRFEQDAIVFW